MRRFHRTSTLFVATGIAVIIGVGVANTAQAASDTDHTIRDLINGVNRDCAVVAIGKDDADKIKCDDSLKKLKSGVEGEKNKLRDSIMDSIKKSFEQND